MPEVVLLCPCLGLWQACLLAGQWWCLWMLHKQGKNQHAMIRKLCAVHMWEKA